MVALDRLPLEPVVPVMIAALLVIHLAGCRASPVPTAACSLDDHAREYVQLIAALGARDPESVDGPRPSPRTSLTAGLLKAGARDLRVHLETTHAEGPDAEREAALAGQLAAVEARAEQLVGARLTFEDESSRLLGLRPAWSDDDDGTLGVLEHLVPGHGLLADRLAEYERQLRVPEDRLPAVMTSALAACHDATVRHVRLPGSEAIEVRYVDGSPWSGYSRYDGHFRSTLEINERLPLTVDRVLDLACHEAYPGHHTLNVLRDAQLVQRRGWTEATVMPVFSPESYALEALASAAPRLAFTEDERVRIERDVLFPLAGLDPDRARDHVRIGVLLGQLDPVVASLTRAYLTGELDYLTAPLAFQKRAAMARPEATLAFIGRYRTYSTAYTAGRSLAWRLVTAQESDHDRWRIYLELALRASLLPNSGQ